MSISFSGGMPPQGVDPNQYAQQYANSKGISVEEAKEELKSKFGNPQQQNNFNTQLSSELSGASNTTTQSGIPPQELERLRTAGVPYEVVAQGENAIMKFAQENNVQLPEKPQLDFNW